MILIYDILSLYDKFLVIENYSLVHDKFLQNYTECQKKLITSSDRQNLLKSTSSKLSYFDLNLAINIKQI